MKYLSLNKLTSEICDINQAKNGVKYQINATQTSTFGDCVSPRLENFLLEVQRRRASTGIKRKRKAMVPLYASNKSLIELGLGHAPRWDDWFVKK
jgi:hypothetical protein